MSESLDIYDEFGDVDRAKVLAHFEAILRRTDHKLTSFQRADIIALLDELWHALPPEHECIGEEEAERAHDVYVWERSMGMHPEDRQPQQFIQHGTITGRF